MQPHHPHPLQKKRRENGGNQCFKTSIWMIENVNVLLVVLPQALFELPHSCLHSRYQCSSFSACGLDQSCECLKGFPLIKVQIMQERKEREVQNMSFSWISIQMHCIKNIGKYGQFTQFDSCICQKHNFVLAYSHYFNPQFYYLKCIKAIMV